VISRQYIAEVKLKRDEVPSFEAYPFALPAIRNLEALELHPAVTFIIGENGSGKSTLLEAIAVAWGFNPEGGSRNFSFGTRASHSPLHDYMRLVKGLRRPRDGFFLRAESFFNVATEIERLDAEPGLGPPVGPAYSDRSLHEQSHGESFMALLMNRFYGKGLYILDEPEAALSPQRQLAVLSRLNDLVADESQFIIATHSPLLLAFPDARIYSFDELPVRAVEYAALDHVNVTRDFLNAPERYLRALNGQ